MSVKVERADLGDHLGAGRPGYLVTVDEAGSVHVRAVQMQWDGARHVVTVGVGGRAAANVTATRRATLVSPPRAGAPAAPEGGDGPMHLLVDGRASVDGTAIIIEPSSAVLHVGPT